MTFQQSWLAAGETIAPAGVGLAGVLMVVSSVVFLLVVLARSLQRTSGRLTDAERLLHAMVDAPPAMLRMSDARGLCVLVNRTFVAATGVSAADALGRGWLSAVHPADRTAVEARVAKGGADRSGWAIDYRLRRRDGSWRRVTEHAYPRYDLDGAFLGHVCAAGDLVARDVEREPTAGADPRAEAVHEAPAAQGATSESLFTTLQGILDCSRVESGTFVLERAEFDLHALVEDVLEMHAAEAAARRIDLACAWPRDLPPTWLGDRRRLRQVLAHALSDAIEYTSASEVWLRVGPAGVGETAGVRVEVRDSVVGVAADVRRELFERVMSGAHAGLHTDDLGLGLTIARTLIEQMGGEMGFTSTLGVGCSLWFTVRLAPGRAPGRSAVARADEPLRGRLVVARLGPRAVSETVAPLLTGWGAEVIRPNDDGAAWAALDAAARRQRPVTLLLAEEREGDAEQAALIDAVQREWPEASIVHLTWTGGRAARGHDATRYREVPRPVRPTMLLETLLAASPAAPAAWRHLDARAS